ncbi:MAG: hypothetical protein RI897_1991 [Verrucomicrobiota bacterium]
MVGGGGWFLPLTVGRVIVVIRAIAEAASCSHIVYFCGGGHPGDQR